MKNKSVKLLSIVLLGLTLVSCGGPNTTSTPASTAKPTDKASDVKPGGDEKIDVKELTLELSKSVAKVGDVIDATVVVKPSNATNKEYALTSSDESIAIIEEGKVKCVGAGSVVIIARSKANATKKAEANLTVLGTDEYGRSENLFEAEDANIIQANSGTGAHVETTSDERVTGAGVVAGLSKDDRVVLGIQAAEAEDNALLKLRLMGPSGWLGMWDSIPYVFGDWFSVKVNGKLINTDDINVEGTNLKGGSADYYNMTDVTIGDVALKAGLNTITFVVSNRYDQTTINDDTYNGTLSCWGNLDSMKLFAKTELTAVPNTSEVEDADPDVATKTVELKANDANTAVFNGSAVRQDMSGKTFAEFGDGVNIVMGLDSDMDVKVKFDLDVIAPYLNTTDAAIDTNLADMITLILNDNKVDLSGLVIKGNGKVADKTNNTVVSTGWVDLKEGENKIAVLAKNPSVATAFWGGLNSIKVNSYKGTITSKLIEKAYITSTYSFEAEGDNVVRVGYDALPSSTSIVEFKDAYKVQTDTYKAKYATNGIIFGIESDIDATATLKVKVATPYIDTDTVMEDVNLGNICDLWVNGKMISTPNTLSGNNKKGVKDNIVEVEIAAPIVLKKGKNRIEFAPRNYTENAYAYLGGLDSISLTTIATINDYKVKFWTDRYTYFDDDNNEPIYVTSEPIQSNWWYGLYREEDTVEENQPGSLYWYYSSQTERETFNLMGQHPNSERPLLSAATGGYFKVVLMSYDSPNEKNGYPVEDVVYISCWNDPDEGYGGRIA